MTERARDLARHEPFAYTWRLLVVALGDLGDRFVELRGDEVDAFISEAISPDADLLALEASRLEAAASARRPVSIVHDAVKVADAARGSRPNLPTAGVPRPIEVV